MVAMTTVYFRGLPNQVIAYLPDVFVKLHKHTGTKSLKTRGEAKFF